MQEPRRPNAFVSFVLHAHLPYVVNHGTWPHGMEWLHEAAAETYLPLLRTLRSLERDGVPFHATISFSPVLLEQLSHPVFVEEFPRYLGRKITAAQEDEAFFEQSGERNYVELARFWRGFFETALSDWQVLGGSIVGGFRHFDETGLISAITCCATHGYMPLLGTDESVRAQVRVAVATHERHFGRRPRGIWAPECGYRPAGSWSYPVGNADGSPAPAAFPRVGVEQVLSESGLEFFIVDTHLIEGSRRAPGVYELRDGYAAPPVEESLALAGDRHLYQPYFVDGAYEPADKRYAVSVFPRDPGTGSQVWSGDAGYPGDGVYLDFHKKRWPGGHRYWRVSGPRVDMEAKQPYEPWAAAEKIRGHAAHFAHLLWEALSPSFSAEQPPILCAPFDAELFGHWWFEGPRWLEAVARNLHDYDVGVDLTTAVSYLDRFPRAGFLSMPEGSWGAGGNNQVWLNPETSWTWTHIYPAEQYLRKVATGGRWRQSQLGTSIVQQLCRELLLLESSDWQFLITTGAARDYAEARFVTHSDQFNELRALWEGFASTGALTPEGQARLDEIMRRDGLFPEIDPAFWAAGSHAEPADSGMQETYQPSGPALAALPDPLARNPREE